MKPASEHVFNRAVGQSLALCAGISDQRAGEYLDSWALENVRTALVASTLDLVGRDRTPEGLRLIVMAALCDVKMARLSGPYKEDTLVDLINYIAAYRSLRADYGGDPVKRRGAVAHRDAWMSSDV